MNLFSGAMNRLLGNVVVSHQDNIVTISGAPGTIIVDDIQRTLRTSVVANMFTNVSRNSLSFPEFFALEMEYILRRIQESKRNVYSSAATIQQCIDELHAKTWLAKIQEGEDVPLKLNNLKRIEYELTPHQKQFLAWYSYAKDRYSLNGMLLAAAPGAGKAQPLDAAIKIPGGWSTMGEMEVGTVVSTPDGQSARVVGVFPQGVKPIYRVTFADGRSTRVCLEHLWNYQYSANDRWITASTADLMDELATGRDIYVPLPKSSEVDTYTGAADMYLQGANLNEGQVVPDSFLNGSHSQRLALLQGLLDSVRCVCFRNEITYTCHTPELAHIVQYLVRSVGGEAKLTKHESPDFTRYHLNITHRYPKELFRRWEKQRYCLNGKFVEGSRVVSIVYEELEEAQCIMIDHPDHLYITDEFVVTHNTISCISVAETIEADKVIVIAPANAVENVWQRTLNENMTVTTPNWVSKFKDTMPVPRNCKYFIYHYEDIHVAIMMVQKGIIKGEKICVILDESHNFNDINSQRTQRFEMLCKLTKSKDIIYSSGTPIKAMGADTIPLLRVLDPYFNELAEQRFRKIFGKNAAKANDLLANRLAIISYKVPKEKFRPEKPIEIPLKVKIPNGEYYTLPAIKIRMAKFIDERANFYKAHKKDFEKDYFDGVNIAKMQFNSAEMNDFKRYESIVTRFHKFGFDSYSDGPDAKWANAFEKNVIMPKLGSDMRKLFKDAKSVYKYVELKIRGEALGNVLSKERNDAIVALAKELDYRQLIDTSKKKVIFFASHTEAVHTVVQRTRALGYHPLMVTAETNKDLKSIVGKFRTDMRANPLAATFQSLSAAVPLVEANTVVALNTPFRSLDMEQAVSRCDRMGQDSQVYVYICTIDTGDVANISTRSADIMEWSREQVAQIMGYKSREDLEIDDIPSMESYMSAPWDPNSDDSTTMVDAVGHYQELMTNEELDECTDDYDIPSPTDHLASTESAAIDTSKSTPEASTAPEEDTSIDDFI